MLNNFLQTYQANRQLTYVILENLTEEDLYKKWSRPGLDSFCKHFQEMAYVTSAYAKAMVTGNMDFSGVPDVFSFQEKMSREELQELLQKSDETLSDIVKNKKYKDSVFWFDMDLPVDAHFMNIISHEVFHHGMMTMHMYQDGVEMPQELLESWSLPKVQ